MHVLNVEKQCLLFCNQSFLKVIFDSLRLCLLCLHEGAADLGQGRIFCYACTIKFNQYENLKQANTTTAVCLSCKVQTTV